MNKKKKEQDEKQYQLLWRKFRNTVENEWLFYDKELERVLDSMLNVRGRLPTEAKMLQACSDYGTSSHTHSGFKRHASWKLHGFRSIRNDAPSCIGFMNVSDIRKTYDHDLLQHEKLFSMLRKFIKKLFDVQNTLTRNLDDLMRHHLHCVNDAVDDEQVELDCSNGIISIDNATEFYTMLSRELFRKQQMIGELLEADVFDVVTLASCLKDWTPSNKSNKSFIQNSKFKETFDIN